MNENTVDYILGRLSRQDKTNDLVVKFAKNTSECLTGLAKDILKVKEFNKSVSVFAFLCVVGGCLGVRKIKELEDEIKELKKSKGE